MRDKAMFNVLANDFYPNLATRLANIIHARKENDKRADGNGVFKDKIIHTQSCLLYTSPSPRD